MSLPSHGFRRIPDEVRIRQAWLPTPDARDRHTSIKSCSRSGLPALSSGSGLNTHRKDWFRPMTDASLFQTFISNYSLRKCY